MIEENSDGANITLSRVAEVLRAARRALILTHRNPDGDAVGSAAALAVVLRHVGARVTVVCPDAVPEYLLVVPGAPEIGVHIPAQDWDLVVTVDVSDPALLWPLPVTDPSYFAGRATMNIDHHYSNLHYARYNYVDAAAASTTEIIARLMVEHFALAYTAEVATDLLYGIVNDTHSFQNSNTTPATLRVSADLMAAGADLATIVFTLLLEKRPAAARLWAQVLPTLAFAEQGRVALLTVSLEAMERADAAMTDADGLVEFLRNIQGVELAILFKQTAPDWFRLSLRTSAAVDATVVAGVYGGGGHQRASGGDAHGDLPEIQRRLLEAYAAARTSPQA